MSSSKKSKRTASFGRLFQVILFIVLLLVAYMAGQASNKTEDKGTVSKPGWKVFNNPQYNYSIKYPEHFTVEADDPESVVFDKQYRISVSDDNPADIRGDGPGLHYNSDQKIGQYTFAKYDGLLGRIGGNDPQKLIAYIVQKNGLFYRFTVYELKTDADVPFDRVVGDVSQAKVAMLEQMMATLKITDAFKDWKTYINKEEGFQIKYPKDAQLQYPTHNTISSEPSVVVIVFDNCLKGYIKCHDYVDVAVLPQIQQDDLFSFVKSQTIAQDPRCVVRETVIGSKSAYQLTGCLVAGGSFYYVQGVNSVFKIGTGMTDTAKQILSTFSFKGKE